MNALGLLAFLGYLLAVGLSVWSVRRWPPHGSEAWLDRVQARERALAVMATWTEGSTDDRATHRVPENLDGPAPGG